MASNVFPMLSSSPPPIDDCADDDEDDEEFGNFTSANIPFDSSFDSPVVEKFQSFKSGDNGVNVNFSDEIHKFNSFSNPSTPSPHESVPSISEESDRCKNGFKPIKREKCRNSENEFDSSSNRSKTVPQTVTSHKPVPLKPENSVHSSRDSNQIFSESCDINSKSSTNSFVENDTSKHSSELTFNKTSLPVCDSPKYKIDSKASNDEKTTGTTLSKVEASITGVEFCQAEVDRVSLNDETSLAADKFDCHFKTTDNNVDEFEDFQQSESLFPVSDALPFSSKSARKILTSENDPGTTCVSNREKPTTENSNDLSDGEFDDFQGCGGDNTFAQSAGSSVKSDDVETAASCAVNGLIPERPFGFSDGELNTPSCWNAETSKSLDGLEPAVGSSNEKSLATGNSRCSDGEFDDFQSCEDKNALDQVAGTCPESFGDFTVTCVPSEESKEAVKDLSDNEFDDFQSCGEKSGFAVAAESSVKSDDNLEFDDFKDFQGSAVPDEGADDFADFQDFSAADASNADDFADFSAVPFDSNKTSQPPEESEFADFEDAAFSVPAENSNQALSAPQKCTDTLSTVINAIFPISDTSQDYDTSEETSAQIVEQTNKSRRLWEKLHEVEQTPGLRFQWGVSHTFQQLLRSVNVDYHSILRTSSVPIFASGLSLLEPVKGLSSSVNHNSEDKNQIPKDPIPPVEFDWNSSGLINPLDSGQAASTLMDLSFLSSVETDTNSTSKDHSFENELLKPSPAVLCPENNNKTPILEQLLSKNVCSLPNSKITHRPSDLSEEAVRVLDQLPDLTFMQAKVLMFPISSKT